MTQNDKQLILKAASNEVSKEEFIQRFSQPIVHDTVRNFFFKAHNEKNSDDLYYAFLLGWYLNQFNLSFVEILNKLLLEEWHTKHEDIVDLLKQFKSPGSVTALYQTALKKFDYLAYDNSIPLASKCAYALFFIHNEEAKRKLSSLSQKKELQEIREDLQDLLDEWD